MKRFPRSVLVIAVLSAAAALSSAQEQQQKKKPQETQAKEEGADEPSQKPSQAASAQQNVTVNEYVFVEGSLPYVPHSNTIVTKLPLDRWSTPNNVGFVTEPLMEEQFDKVLGDSLVNVSNVNVQTQSGVADFFYIRGFDSLSSGLILTDGAPEPETSFYQMYNVELVEVLKGPGGFLYGSHPLAGAVNLVRKQPLPAKLLRFGASAGSYDNYEGFFDWNYGDDRAAFRVNGLYRDQGSYRDGKSGRAAAINPAARIRLGERSSLNLNVEYLDLSYIPDAGIPVLRDRVAPVDRSTSYQTGLDDSSQQYLRFQGDYEWRVSDRLSIRDKFFQRSLDWLSRGTIFNAFVLTGPTSFGAIRTLATLDDSQHFTGNQLEAVLDVETGPVRHSLLAGFELDRFADRYQLDAALLPLIDVLHPVEPEGSSPIPLPDQTQTGDSRSIVAAPYIVDQIRFTNELNVLLGGRLDAIDFKEDVTGRSRTDNEFSPMVGVLYAFDPELSIYGNYSRSFAPPSPRVVGELVPERGTQYEGGVKKRFSRFKADTTFAVYQLERDNIAIPDDNGFTQQVGNQRSRGFEIDVAAEPVSSFRTFFAYAYNDAVLTRFAESLLVSLNPPTLLTLDRSGNRPAFAPKHVMNFWLSKDFSSRWGVGGGARYVSSQYIAEDNEFQIKGVLTFDATAFYRFGDFRLRLNLKNITDQEYYLRGFGGTSVIPAPPFTAFLGFDVDL